VDSSELQTSFSKRALIRGTAWNLDLAYTLLDFGADIHARQDFFLVEASRRSEHTVIQTLIEKYQADPNAGDCIALWRCANDGNVSAVKTLLSCGANPKLRPNLIRTLATKSSPNIRLMELLLRSGATISNKDWMSFRRAGNKLSDLVVKSYPNRIVRT
jgi:hypothetical protein